MLKNSIIHIEQRFTRFLGEITDFFFFLILRFIFRDGIEEKKVEKNNVTTLIFYDCDVTPSALYAKIRCEHLHNIMRRRNFFSPRIKVTLAREKSYERSFLPRSHVSYELSFILIPKKKKKKISDEIYNDEK